MASWRHENIYVYFNDIFGSMGENCLPYMPENFTCNIPGRNEEVDIIEGIIGKTGMAGTMNLLKRPGLKTWSIDCFFSHPDRPLYATVSESENWDPDYWVEFFESAMYQKKVIEMTVTGLDIVTYVTIENFKHTKEAGEEIDTYYTIDIKEYEFQEIKEEKVNIVQEIPSYDGASVGGQQPTKADLGNTAYFIGVPYRQLIDGELKFPFIWIFTNGNKNVEGLTYFDYMPVNIIDRKPFKRDIKTTSNLSNFIVNFGKEYSVEHYDTIDSFFKESILAAVDKEQLYLYFPGWQRKPTLLEISSDATWLRNHLLRFIKQKYGIENTGRVDKDIMSQIWTLYLDKEPDFWKNYFIYIDSIGGMKFQYIYKNSINIEFCQCETLQEFGVNMGSASALSLDARTGYHTGVDYYPKGTKIWGYANRREDDILSYVTTQNNGNIPFTIKGVNKQGGYQKAIE